MLPLGTPCSGPSPGGHEKCFSGPYWAPGALSPFTDVETGAQAGEGPRPDGVPGLGPGPPVLFSSQLGDDAPWDCVPRRLAPPAGPLSLHKALAALIHTATS